jgi:hypothetical protein
MIKKFIILDKIIVTFPMILYQHPMNIGGGKRLHRNCFQIKRNKTKKKKKIFNNSKSKKYQIKKNLKAATTKKQIKSTT